jgi:hypothetical protein
MRQRPVVLDPLFRPAEALRDDARQREEIVREAELDAARLVEARQLGGGQRLREAG